MYPFNAMIARCDYDALDEVSRDFARGRLTVRPAQRRQWHRPAWFRFPKTGVPSWRLRFNWRPLAQRAEPR